ncbi:LamG domain-containing protein, partial [Candidatus Micrarchaeota archaeon]|nr:LamG domain-containing protein [Candidatus Micrarchaeota archaeon]
LIIVNINVFGAGVGNGSDTLTVTSNATFTPGYWYHVGFTFNQGDLNLYVNGSHDISDHSDAVTDANGHNGADMVIGARNNTGAGSFPGQIEDFKIYNRVLTPAEIQADYNAWWNANYYSRVLDGFESGVEVCKDCNYSSATLNYNNNASMSGLGLFVRNCTSTSVCTNSWTQETGFTNGTNFDLNNGFGYQGRYLQFRLDQSITSGWDHANFDDTVTHVQDVNIIMVATPPTTTDDHNEGWQNFDANITLTCTDNVGGSGCDTTTYELDGGGEETYDTNILISTDANHQLDYYSTDVAGDIESTKTVLVTIDKTDPTVTITSTIDDINVGLSFVLSYEGADATSGIAKYWVSNNSETWIDNGTETSYLFTEDPETPAPFTRIYYVKSMDNADNNSTAQGISVTYTGTGSGVVSGTYCGNNSCDGSEAAITCPADCPAACGDRSCTHTESPITCPVDCAIGCGNLICEPKEDSSNCSTDCGVDTGDISIIPAGICGNNVCELNETTQSCSNDCGINSVPVIRERILNISVKKVVLVEEFKRFSKILADYGRIVEPVFMERASKIFNITSEATAQVIKTGENNEDIGSRTEFKVNIENTSNVPMDIRVMTFIEKEIAEDASKIVSETPFTIIESDPIIEFLIEALKPGETFPVTYYINKTIDESALQEIDPPIISGFEISDPGKVEQTYCARHEDCDDQSICTIEKCINGHCYFGSQSEGESCGMGAGACAGGKCVSKTLPTYQPPQAIGLTTILLLVIIALLSLWIIKEYTIKT